MAKQPEKPTAPVAAEPASAATPAPDASPSLAAAPAFKSSAELTHKLHMYGALIRTSFDHTSARLTFNAGEEREYHAPAGVQPTAFEQARQAAKDAYKADQEATRAARLAKRKGTN